MRRWIVIGCIFLLFLSGCQTAEREDSEDSMEAPALTEEEALFLTDGYLSDYDAQNQFSVYKDAARVGDIIYFKFGANMYYYDMNTGITAPLCGKAECNHTSGSCNAYFWDVCGFCYYNQKIYWVEWENDHYYLASMNLDGSQHERVQEMPEPFVFNEYLSNMRIHRGYVYIGEEIGVVEDGQYYNHLVISRVKLGEEESEPEVIIDKVGDGVTGYGFYMNFWGNTMYLLERDFKSEGEDKGFTYLLYGYDIHTGEIELLSETSHSSLASWDFMVTESGIYLSVYYLEDTAEHAKDEMYILQYNPNVNEWEKLAEIPYINEAGSPTLLEKEIIVTKMGWDEPRCVIMDFDGTVIRTCDFPLSDTQTNVSVLPLISTEEYVIFYLRPIGGGMDSIILVPLDPEEELQVLCS